MTGKMIIGTTAHGGTTRIKKGIVMDIEQLKADIAAGTPGPWLENPGHKEAIVDGDGGMVVHDEYGLMTNDDIRLALQAPVLAAEVIRLTKRNELLEAQWETSSVGVWRIGAPDRVSGSEWFIAKDKHGRRVVLRRLDDNHSYDYEDGSGTYYADGIVAAWMQFPDAHFLPPDTATESECPYAKIATLTKRLKLADELALAFCNLQERANGDYEDDNGERAYMVQHQEMSEASESLTAYREGKP